MKPTRYHLSGNDPEYYERAVQVGKEIFKGYLTYEIKDELSFRNLLIINYRGKREDKLISPSNMEQFSTFKNGLDIVAEPGSFRKVKTFATSLDKKNHPTSFIKAIHLLGPVPVFDTGNVVNFHIDGIKRPVRIVLYYTPYALKLEQGIQTPKPVQDNLLLKSIDGYLPQIFTRYFEDIAAILRDITNNCDLERTVVLAKEIENIIGRSIQSKLNCIAPKITREVNELAHWQLENINLKESEQTRKSFFIDNHLLISSADFFKDITLYLINCLYASIGVSSQREKYLKRLKTKALAYEDYFGDEFISSLSESTPEIAELYNYMMHLMHHKKKKVFAEPATKCLWLTKFVEFIRLLYWLEEYKAEPLNGRFFISFKQKIPEGKHLKDQIKHFFEKNKDLNIETFSLDENDLADHFEERIKAMIWQSDKSIALLLGESREIEVIPENYHEWILKESEHSVMQGKGVLFAKQKSISNTYFDNIFENTIEQALANKFSFLTKYSRTLPQKRIENLIAEWKQHSHVTYSIDLNNLSPQFLDPALKFALEVESQKVLQGRYDQLIRGMLTLIPLRSLIFLYCITSEHEALETGIKLSHIRSMFSHKWEHIRKKLNRYTSISEKSSIDSEFVNLIRNCKQRSIMLHGSPSFILKTEKKGSTLHKIGLFKIYTQLYPDFSKEKVEEKVKYIIESVASELMAKSLQKKSRL